MVSRTSAETNRLIGLLKKNPQMSKQQLCQLYLAAVKRTHPDAVSSEQYTKEFIRYREDYGEACDWLARNPRVQSDEVLEDNARFSFYRALHRMCECEYPVYRKENFSVLLPSEKVFLMIFSLLAGTCALFVFQVHREKPGFIIR